uniref:O-acyltransferase WSD1 C-terminal domain-containing protein n=1 Tax=Timema tahoe TaxID=61484 RepID=A0A7R9FG30_9NEOP|nr:unnamed protein product [Timema tahoe]
MAVALVRRAFHKHPFLFNCMVHGTLYTGTNFSQQTFRSKIMKSEIEHPKSFDIGSLSRYGVVGFAIYPIMLHNWYKWLDKHYVGTAAKTVVKKLLLDQFLFTPPLIAAFYINELLVLASCPDSQLPIVPACGACGVCGFLRLHLGQHPLLVQTTTLLRSLPLPAIATISSTRQYRQAQKRGDDICIYTGKDGVFLPHLNISSLNIRDLSQPMTSAANLGLATGFLLVVLLNSRFETIKREWRGEYQQWAEIVLARTVFVIACLLLFLAATPLVMLIFIFLMFYRQTVQVILWLVHGKRFAGLMEGADTVWALEDDTSKSVINILAMLQVSSADESLGEGLLTSLRQLVLSRVLTSPQRCPKLLYYRRKSALGYFYWERQNELHLENHIRWMETGMSISDGISEEILGGVISELANAPLPDQHASSWEILVGRNFISEPNTNVKTSLEEDSSNHRSRSPMFDKETPRCSSSLSGFVNLDFSSTISDNSRHRSQSPMFDNKTPRCSSALSGFVNPDFYSVISDNSHHRYQSPMFDRETPRCSSALSGFVNPDFSSAISDNSRHRSQSPMFDNKTPRCSSALSGFVNPDFPSAIPDNSHHRSQSPMFDNRTPRCSSAMSGFVNPDFPSAISDNSHHRSQSPMFDNRTPRCSSAMSGFVNPDFPSAIPDNSHHQSQSPMFVNNRTPRCSSAMSGFVNPDFSSAISDNSHQQSQSPMFDNRTPRCSSTMSGFVNPDFPSAIPDNSHHRSQSLIFVNNRTPLCSSALSVSKYRCLGNFMHVICAIIYAPASLLHQALMKASDANTLHGPSLSGQKVIAWYTDSSTSTLDDECQLLNTIKRIKSRAMCEARFTDIFLTALSASLEAYFVTGGSNGNTVPESINVVVPLRMEPFPTKAVEIIKGEDSSKVLKNVSVEDPTQFMPTILEDLNELNHDYVVTGKKLNSILKNRSFTKDINPGLTFVDISEDKTSNNLLLDNRFSVALMTLPIVPPSCATSEKIMKSYTLRSRLKEVCVQSELLRKSLDYQINYWLMRVVATVLPAALLSPVLRSTQSTMVVSNMKGPAEDIQIGGYKLTDLVFWVPNRGTTGVGVTLMSYAGRLQIGIIADRAVVPCRQDAQLILQGVVSELKHLDAMTSV